VEINGYPDEYSNYRPLDIYGKKIELLQYGQARSNRIIFIKPQQFIIAYAISTLPGESGSPVCVDNKIIAIHNGGGQKDD
jgi:hypothetical protein